MDSGYESTRILTPAGYRLRPGSLKEHRFEKLPVSVKVQERVGEKVALVIEDG